MQLDTLVYNIDKSFITAIGYNDFTGLSDDDIKDLSDFMINMQQAIKANNNGLLSNYHFSYEGLDDTDYRRCDITTMFADCCKLTVHFSVNEDEDVK